MERIKTRNKKYEISVRENRNYFEARISLKFGNERSTRLQKSGTTIELAVLHLLIAIEQFIDMSFEAGLITNKIDNIISKRIMTSVNDMEIESPEVTKKLLVIIDKINNINENITNNTNMYLNLPINNVTNLYPDKSRVSEKVKLDTIQDKKAKEVYTIDRWVNDWLKYKFNLCIKSDENPKPLSRKTIDGYNREINEYILPYCKKNGKLYLSQLNESFIEELLKSIKGQTMKRHIYVDLNLLFKYAVKIKKIEFNFMVNIKKPVVTKRKSLEDDDIDYIDSEEQTKWLDIFESDMTDLAVLFETMLLTGLRPEEACGLKWKALDLEKNELIIDNAFKRFVKYDKDMNPIRLRTS